MPEMLETELTRAAETLLSANLDSGHYQWVIAVAEWLRYVATKREDDVFAREVHQAMTVARYVAAEMADKPSCFLESQ